MKKIILLILINVLMLSLTGCFPTYSNENEAPAGFFKGVWHGWIAPISLLVEIFDSNIKIYETNNTGWFYDFGFYIAIIAGFGGLALRRKKSDG